MSSQLRVDKIIPVDGVPTGGGGGIIQVVQTYKTDTFTTSSSGDIDVTGLSVSITPKFSTSKILILSFISGFSHNGAGGSFCFRRSISGGASDTKIGRADASSSRALMSFSGHLYTGDASGTGQMHFNTQGCFLDSPSTTSACTYKVTAQSSGNNLYVNRQEDDTDSNDYARGVSHITVMEVSA